MTKKAQGINLTLMKLAYFVVWNDHLVQNFVEQCHNHRLLGTPNMPINDVYKCICKYVILISDLLALEKLPSC